MWFHIDFEVKVSGTQQKKPMVWVYRFSQLLFSYFVEWLGILSQAGDDVNCKWICVSVWQAESSGDESYHTHTYVSVKQHSTAEQDNPKHQIKSRTDTSESCLWSLHSKGSFVLCASLLWSPSHTSFHTFSTGHWQGLLTINTE